MLANMASSLLKHKRINTTVAKAKALRTFIEPLLTRAKDDTTHSRRMVFRYLRDKYAVTELFRDVAPKIADRPGGYTRILKTGNRLGDNAEMCLIELVDFNEAMLAEPKAAGTAEKKPRTRRGRSKKRSGATDPAKTGLSAEAPAKEDAKAEDKPSVEDAEIIEEVEEVKQDKPAEESAEAATKVEATEENSTDTPEEADVSSEAATKEEEPDAEETTTEEEPEEEASKEAVEEEAVEEETKEGEAVEEETKEGEATEEESTGEEEKKD